MSEKRVSGTDFDYTPEEVAQTLAAVDVDGALQETAGAVLPATRREFLGKASVAAAIGVGLAAAPAAGASTAGTKNDVAILRFDLALEYLQAGLYTEAERLGALSPKTLHWSRIVGAHERAHARAIKGLLGSKAVKSPSFNYRGVTEDERSFVKTAVAFEDLTAALLKWQAPRLDSRGIVAAVATLHSVETRHAAWIRHIVGIQPAASAFDEPSSQHEMAKLIASTHFVTSRPKTTSRRKPRFTG
jgi:hypothetical protein